MYLPIRGPLKLEYVQAGTSVMANYPQQNLALIHVTPQHLEQHQGNKILHEIVNQNAAVLMYLQNVPSHLSIWLSCCGSKSDQFKTILICLHRTPVSDS